MSRNNNVKEREKRVRRGKEQTITPIEIANCELELLVSYLNIISENLSDFVKSELGYKLKTINCPIVKSSKIDPSILRGKDKLKKSVIAIFVFEPREIKDVFLRFAKENRYLNITQENNYIKIENSDKYQYFNIEMVLKEDNTVVFTIYSRRFFAVDGKLKRRKIFNLF